MVGYIGVGDFTLVCKGPRPATATPTPRCKDSIGSYKTVNLLTAGTLTSGSLFANQAVINELNTYVIDFTMTVPVTSMMAGYNQVPINIGVADPGNHRDPNNPVTYRLTVNGLPFESEDGSTFTAGASGSALSLHYHAEIPGSPSSGNDETMYVATGAARIPAYQDPGENLLCDAGMEQYPISSHWQSAGDGDNGRLNSFYNSEFMNGVNGTAYCGQGQQAIGLFFIDSGRFWYNGAPIKQPFHWSGGIAQWKFRAHPSELGGSAHVWIMDNAGTDVADLFGSATNYSAGLLDIFGQPWQLKTGSVDLDEGDYWIVLGMGPGISGQAMDYDDVAIGTSVDQACQEDFEVLPTMPTPTPTNTNQPTRSPTPTYQITRYSTSTATVTTTPRGTSTITTTPTITTTARPTRTPTFYPTYTLIPSFTPRASSTLLPTYTPNAQGTIEASATFVSTSAPPGQQPPPDYYADCNRPTNGTDMGGWAEYEKCQILSYFSMSPNAVSTMQSMPDSMGNVEPIGTINELGQTSNMVNGLINQYKWDNPGLPGLSDAPDASQFLATQGPSSPWMGGPVFSNQPVQQTSDKCSTALTDVIGKNLSIGFCGFFNILKEHGIMAWIQVMINISAIAFLIHYFVVKWIDASTGD